MESTRFILLIALGLVLTMLWQAWQEDYPAQISSTELSIEKPEHMSEDLPQISNTTEDNVHKENVSAPMDGLLPDNNDAANLIQVKTDVFDIKINPAGGTIQYVALINYPVSKKKPDEPFVLLDSDQNGFYLMQGGLLSKNTSTSNKTVYAAEKSNYSLDNNETLAVPLRFISPDGIEVIKTYVFTKNSYVVDVHYQIINNSMNVWNGSAYGQLNRTEPENKGSRFVYTFTGAVISSPEKRYEKIKFDEIADANLSRDISNGWAAMLQHYFFSALLPGDKEAEYHYYTLNPNDKSYVIGMITPAITISAGESSDVAHKIYFGPKKQNDVSKVADGLELTADYGIFWFLAKPLFWLLDHIHSFTHNWGWAIILVTLLLKILFFRLSAAGYRSMAKMRKVQPRMMALRDRYKDDRTRLNQEMMEMYKKEKINPLGGCFPILIQIPVFISLYWVLLESVELRQADFILWLHDLSIPDPYFVLPLVMGITMFIQQKLNPAPMDPVQEKVMSVLPVAFTIFFAFFPSGLVLYWVVNNILSIAQQWIITRSIEKS